MPISRFCLQWDNHSKTLTSNLNKLYESQQCVDLKLLCMTQSIGVHKCVLAACSPYFADRFKRSADIVSIIMKGIEYPVIKSLLEFMYTGETNVIEEYVDAVVETANFFKVRGLSGIVTEKIGILDKIKETKQIEDPEFITKNHLVVDFEKNTISDYNLNENNIQTYPDNIEELMLDVSRSELVLEQSSPEESEDIVSNITVHAKNLENKHLSNATKNACLKDKAVNSMCNPDYLSDVNNEQNVIVESIPSLYPINNLYSKEVCEIQNTDAILNADNSDSCISSNGVVQELNEIVPTNVNFKTFEYNKKNIESGKLINEELIEGTIIDENESQFPIESEKVTRVLQEAGVPTDVPVYYEDKNGGYVQLSDQILDDIANGCQVIYQIIDEEGNSSELMLGNSIKNSLNSKTDTSSSIDYNKLVEDVIGNDEYDESTIDVEEETCIVENVSNEFIIPEIETVTHEEPINFLITASDIIENNKSIFQESNEIPIEHAEISQDVIEDEILKINSNQLSEIMPYTSLKCKPLSILLTATDMIENKNIKDKLEMNFLDNEKMISLENTNINFSEIEKDILTIDGKIDSEEKGNTIIEKQKHITGKHVLPVSKKNLTFLNHIINPTESHNKTFEECNILKEISDKCKDISEQPSPFEKTTCVSPFVKKIYIPSSDNSSNCSIESYSCSENDQFSVVCELSKKNDSYQASLKNEILTEVTLPSAHLNSYISSIDSSKDSSTSLNSTDKLDKITSAQNQSPVENKDVRLLEYCDPKKILSEQEISSVNSSTCTTSLDPSNNSSTPVTFTDLSDSNQTSIKNQHEMHKDIQITTSKSNLKEDVDLSKDTIIKLNNKSTKLDNDLSTSITTSVLNNQIPIMDLKSDDSVEQKMAQLHMETSKSDSSPNNILQEIQKIKNVRKRNISEHQNPFSDSETSESNVRSGGTRERIESKRKYQKYLKLSYLKRKKIMQVNQSKIKNISQENIDVQPTQHLRKRKIMVIDSKNEKEISNSNTNTEMSNIQLEKSTSKYDKYLNIAHSRRKYFSVDRSTKKNVPKATENSGSETEIVKLNSLKNVTRDLNLGELNPKMIMKRTRLRKSSSSASDNSGNNSGKEIPYALGLLPLSKALKKIQNMPDHKPRKTRSGIEISKQNSKVTFMSLESDQDHNSSENLKKKTQFKNIEIK